MKTESLKRWAIVSFVVSMLILLGGGYLSIDRVPPYGAILLFYFLITTYPRLKKCEFDDGEIKFCREDL